MTDDHLQRRLGRNESLFREVNDALQRGVWPGEEQHLVRFRCECTRIECSQAVELTADDYEQVRAHARRFVVADGHERSDIEFVVYRGAGYLVVEKRGEAGATAEKSHERAD